MGRREGRWERKKRKKRISKTHRNSNYDIVGTIMKGHQRWSEGVTLAVKHKWAILTLWTISVAHSGYLWSPFLMSLNLSPRDFFYVTNVSKVFFFLFFLYLSYTFNICYWMSLLWIMVSYKSCVFQSWHIQIVLFHQLFF